MVHGQMVSWTWLLREVHNGFHQWGPQMDPYTIFPEDSKYL